MNGEQQSQELVTGRLATGGRQKRAAVPSGILDERQNTVASDTDTEIYLFNLTDRSYDVVRTRAAQIFTMYMERKTDRYFKLPRPSVQLADEKCRRCAEQQPVLCVGARKPPAGHAPRRDNDAVGIPECISGRKRAEGVTW